MGSLSKYFQLKEEQKQALQKMLEDNNTVYTQGSGIADTHQGWKDTMNGKNAVVVPAQVPQTIQEVTPANNPHADRAAVQASLEQQPVQVNNSQEVTPSGRQQYYPVEGQPKIVRVASKEQVLPQQSSTQSQSKQAPASQKTNANVGGYWSNDGPQNKGDINIAPGIAGGGYYIPGPLSQPQVDTNDPINSLASILVTPAEREAMEQRALRNKRRMIAWTGLFDGLRQLGNLYFTTKGATPQQFTDKPYQQIEADYQAEMKRQDDLAKNRENYAKQLWNLKRQGVEDARKKALADAQVKWYDTRGEIARIKAENDRLKAENDKRKAEKDLEVKEARRKQIETKTKQLEELHPLQKEKLKATIKNTLHNANRPYSSGSGGKGRGSSTEDPFKTLAEQLQDNPDIIGPILEQEGYGFYDAEKKEFNFSKNATKGMATTATRRASRQISQKKSGSLLPGNNSKKQKKGSLLPK